MRSIIKILSLLLIAALLLTACKKDDVEEGGDPTTPPDIETEEPVTLEPFAFTSDGFPRMDGCPSAVPLAGALASIMLGQSRDDVSERIMFTATTQAFRNLAAGVCDLLLVGEPYPPVLDEIASQDFRYDIAPIATDALVFIVSTSNPINNLTSAQVKAIYSGASTNWNQIGGSSIEIIPFQRNEEAMSQVLVSKLVMDWEDMTDAPMQSIFNTSFFDPDLTPNAIKGFDGSEGAIGFTMYYYAVNMSMADGFKILSVDGIMPTPDTIASGDYPFINPYYAVINRDLPEDDNARILFNWLLSEDGQDFISSEGYVSIKESQSIGDIAPVEPEPMRWSVVTDSSNLTSFVSRRSHSARLYDASLTELVAFDGYGPLLKYSTAVTMNDGSIISTKYGFVAAQSGTVVTDPIYDSIDRAVQLTQSGSTGLSAYRLSKIVQGDEPDAPPKTLLAACSDDGRWITPFSYESIIFRENIIFLVRAADTFDIDVYDYNGEFLYNILELEWADRISEDEGPDHLVYSEGENLGWLLLDNGAYALIDMLTGDMEETNIVSNTGMFSDGLAAAAIKNAGGKWGFVDKDLNIVIPAEYSGQSVFVDGRAIVVMPDNSLQVIDKEGKSLFSVASGHSITNLENYGYSVYSLETQTFTFYTYDFREIKYPSDALPLTSEADVRYMRDGWILCMTEDGAWLFKDGETLTVPGSISQVMDYYPTAGGGYIIYAEYSPISNKQLVGVMTIDGSVIIDAQENQSIIPIYTKDGLSLFAVNINAAGDGIFGAVGDSYKQVRYELIDLSGGRTKSDLGILSLDEVAGYCYVQGTDYSAWLSGDGDMFISIPSMAYSFD